MLKFIVAFMGPVISMGAFAASMETSEKALKLLMNQNPQITMSSGVGQPVNSLIAYMMTSSFEPAGEGALSVSKNSCRTLLTSLTCHLEITTSDRTIDAKGAYVPSDHMTETTLNIYYSTDLSAERLLQAPSYSETEREI